MIDAKLRWNRSKILSYNKLFNLVVGARDIGKSYQAKDMAISLWIRGRKTTKWVMRYRTELEKALNENDFLHNLYDKRKGWQLRYDIDGCYIRYNPDGEDDENGPKWEKFMSFQSMSERALKGAEDPDCELVVFDEFIPLPGTPYIKEEVTRFLEYYYTVCRERPVRCLMLSNNVTVVSPYFSYFNVKLPPKGEFYVGEEIIIENCRNDAFAEMMHATRFGKLIAGTKYAKYAIDNDSMVDLDTFLIDRPHDARCFIRIKTYMGDLYMWLCKPSSVLISLRGDPKAPCWAMDEKSHDENSVRADFAGSLGRKFLRSHYARGTLFFDSKEAKAIFLQACAQILK